MYFTCMRKEIPDICSSEKSLVVLLHSPAKICSNSCTRKDIPKEILKGSSNSQANQRVQHKYLESATEIFVSLNVKKCAVIPRNHRMELQT